MGLVAHDKLIKTLNTSIMDANALFEKWSGGWWLIAYATESFLVSQMATAIMEIKPPPTYLTLETQFKEVFNNQEKKIDGRNRFYDDNINSRLDIALYSGKNLSHAIEVKRFWSPECLKDIDRLCKLHSIFNKKFGGTFRHCIFVQYIYAKAHKGGDPHQALKNGFTRCEKKCAERIKEHGLAYQFNKGTEFSKAAITNDGQICSSYSITIKSKE